MLTLTIAGIELYDQDKEEFFSTNSTVLQLEHSLVSLSKWESKFEKPFLGETQKTPEEFWYYVECMVLTEGFAPEVLAQLTASQYKEIADYIESKQHATFFAKMENKRSRGEIVTSELIYYWLVAFNIPFVTETWHLNRLFALIQVCNTKNQPPKALSKTEKAQQMQRNRELNEQRKAQLGTKG